MRKSKIFHVLIIAALTAAALGGCYYGVGESASPATESPPQESRPAGESLPAAEYPIPESFPVPENNRMAITPLWHEFLAASGSDGLFTVTANNVCYYDLEAKRSSIWCYQAGCRHNDETCPAYFGNLERFLAYEGKWYVLTRTGDEAGYDLIKYDPGTGKRERLASWTPESGDYYEISSMRIAYGRAYLQVTLMTTRDVPEAATGVYGEALAEYYASVDLDSGEVVNYSVDPAYEVLAVSRDGVCLVQSALTDYATDEEYYAAMREYTQARGGTGAWEFRLAHTHYSLGTYELETGEYEKIVDSDGDGYIISGDSSTCYGGYYIYQCGDTLWYYDINERSSHEILTMPDIINYWILDRKAMFITEDGDGVCKVWYADLFDGEPVRLGNGGRTDSMDFSIIQESDNHFLGLYRGENRRIRKDDFYADRYENAF